MKCVVCSTIIPGIFSPSAALFCSDILGGIRIWLFCATRPATRSCFQTFRPPPPRFIIVGVLSRNYFEPSINKHWGHYFDVPETDVTCFGFSESKLISRGNKALSDKPKWLPGARSSCGKEMRSEKEVSADVLAGDSGRSLNRRWFYKEMLPWGAAQMLLPAYLLGIIQCTHK